MQHLLTLAALGFAAYRATQLVVWDTIGDRLRDRIELWPAHIDPTINLHDVLVAVDGDEVVEVWPVSARGYREQRMLVER